MILMIFKKSLRGWHCGKACKTAACSSGIWCGHRLKSSYSTSYPVPWQWAWESSKGQAKCLGFCTHVAELEKVRASIWPSPGYSSHLGNNQRVKGFFSLSLSVFNSAFQVNKIHFLKRNKSLSYGLNSFLTSLDYWNKSNKSGSGVSKQKTEILHKANPCCSWDDLYWSKSLLASLVPVLTAFILGLYIVGVILAETLSQDK